MITSLLALLLSATMLIGADTTPEHYSWRAHLIDDHGQPVPYANVVVHELNRGTVSDEQGHVWLNHLPRGEFEINISFIGYVNKSVRIHIPQQPGDIQEVQLQHTILEGSVVTVSVTGLPTDILHSERTVSVMEGEELQRKVGQSLSATMSDVPGLQILSQGHAVTKPVIRGMTNQRIVILKDGIRMEGQQWGGHHSPEADVLSIGRIEVVRGPMGLIYGSEAMGGVIQIQSPDLPTLDEGGKFLRLAGRAGFHANSQQTLGGIGLQKAWQRSAIRINAQVRMSDDYAAPGDDQFLKRVPGTDFEQESANLQLVKKFTRHEVELLASHYKETQSLIGEGHWHNSGGGPDGTDPWYHVLGTIVSPTTHQNLTLKGKWVMEHSWVEYDAGVQHNYRQGGPEGETPAVDITTDTRTANFRWRHVVQDKLPGTIGLSLMQKSSESIGPERLLPDYLMTTAGLFSYYRWKWSDLTFSGGLRVDASQYDIQTSSFPGLVTTDDVVRNYFPITSGSVGIVWHQVELPYSIAMNIGTGWRPLNPYELYIDGIHHGDWKIERGDPDLEPESSVNTDIILRHIAGSHSGELTFFYNELTNYVTSSPTGVRDGMSGIPIYQITQGDARTFGTEMRLEFLLKEHLRADLGWDVMWGELLEEVSDVDGDGSVESALPSINPPRILSGLAFEMDQLLGLRKVNIEVGAEHVFAQKHLAEYENLVDDTYGGILFIEPESYDLLNVSLHGGLKLGDRWIDISLGVDNILNTQYYSHLSRYKGMAFDQGFNLRGEIRIKL